MRASCGFGREERHRRPDADRPRSRTTSMGQCMADRAALRASVPRELKLEPDAGNPVATHVMDNQPDQSDPDGIAH